MLIKFWERLRGSDRWIETTANFTTANLEKTTHVDKSGNVSSTWGSLDTIAWTDRFGTEHSADFRVPDSSPIYQMIDGDKATIRYDPTNPERYYYRDLFKSRVVNAMKKMLWTLAIITFFIGYFWLRAQFFVR
jgi:hypothetical protein